MNECTLPPRVNKHSVIIHVDRSGQEETVTENTHTNTCNFTMGPIINTDKYKVWHGTFDFHYFNYCKWIIIHTSILEFLSSPLVNLIFLISWIFWTIIILKYILFGNIIIIWNVHNIIVKVFDENWRWMFRGKLYLKLWPETWWLKSSMTCLQKLPNVESWFI
jgi:hypothetical protein